MWTLRIISGIWKLDLKYENLHDACELLHDIVEHSDKEIEFSIIPEKEGEEKC